MRTAGEPQVKSLQLGAEQEDPAASTPEDGLALSAVETVEEYIPRNIRWTDHPVGGSPSESLIR